MIIIVLNYSGNVGKSTLAQMLFAPRIKNCKLISVESINSDGTTSHSMTGDEYGELIDNIYAINNAVIDVGSSNVEDFMRLMGEFTGSCEEFDLFVVPVTPEEKQIKDTISTIDALSELGVPAEKIKVVFNKMTPKKDVKDVFAPLINFYEAEKKFTLVLEAVLIQSEVYDRLKTIGMNMDELLNDPKDYKDMAKSAEGDERLRYGRIHATRRLAEGLSKDLDAIYDAVTE